MADDCLGYRLYTVVPRLLSLIDQTTNWYIRFNRSRLKGVYGREDTQHALNTLFDVLFTLSRSLAPFTPFIADNIYLRLLPHIPAHSRGEDDRSVHFLSFPSVRGELFDLEIERRVSRMQKVIELARVSRERRSIGLKTPLKSLIVIHKDAEYLEDILSLAEYIKQELNIRDLILTSDEAKYNVQYSVSADWPVLGARLKNAMPKVKKALPALTSAEVALFVEKGSMIVDGVELTNGDLIVRRGLKDDAMSKTLETNTDQDVLTILDTEFDAKLAEEGIAREIINRVQRLRKKAGLEPTDDIRMEYTLLSDPNAIGLQSIFATQAAVFAKALRRPVDEHAGTDEGLIVREEQEIQSATFMLHLLKL